MPSTAVTLPELCTTFGLGVKATGQDRGDKDLGAAAVWATAQVQESCGPVHRGQIILSFCDPTGGPGVF